jgi:hypothetical protein
LQVSIYPNPTSNRIYFKGIQNATKIDLFSVDGRQLASYSISNDSFVDLNVSSGMYLLNISSDNQTMTKKIIVN